MSKVIYRKWALGSAMRHGNILGPKQNKKEQAYELQPSFGMFYPNAAYWNFQKPL